MWMSSEDARSDFVLAAAAAAFGPILQSFLTGLPLYPRSGTVGVVLALAWLFASTGLVPLLLARYRGQGAAAFGLDEGREGLSVGAIVALPLVAFGWLSFWAGSAGPVGALFGRIGEPSLSTTWMLNLLVLVVALVGVLLLYTFLVVRARDAFKPTHVTQVEALRTFGVGAVGVALVLGLLLAVGTTLTVAGVMLRLAGLLGAILLVDRYVEPGDMTTRATVLAPAIVAAVLWVLSSGGLFSGGLLSGLYAGAVAGATAIVVAILLETRRYAWAVIPLVAAAVLYGSPLSQLL